MASPILDRQRRPSTRLCAEALLLDFDRSASGLEGILGLLGIFLGRAFEHGLRGRLDEILGFLEAEPGERADLFDHLDLLVTGSGEDDVEVRLLLGLFSTTTGGGSGGDSDAYGRSGGDLKLLLNRLDQLVCLDQGQARDGFQKFINLRHF